MRMRNVRALFCAATLLATWSATTLAAPAVSRVSGTLAHGQQVQISGSGFGQKSPAKPYLWAPFENSANPSSLGIVTSWDHVESMGYAPGEGFGGTGALKATDGSGTWTSGVVSQGFAWNDYRQQMYLYRRVKRNFEIGSLNWKIIRVWGANFTSPNWWVATNNGNLSVELGGPNTGGSGGYPYDSGIVSPISGGDLPAARGTANTGQTEEILMKSNSAAGTDDGEFFHYVHGRLVGVMPYTSYERRGLTLRASDSTNDMRLIFPVHGVKANATLPSHYRYWVDDLYLDTTWARVVVGNAPSLANCTHLEVQIPFEWSADRIGVTMNLQSFPAGQPRYLFVVDASGSKSSGYLLGNEGPVPLPPENVRAD